jgi:hypothetical protein
MSPRSIIKKTLQNLFSLLATTPTKPPPAHFEFQLVLDVAFLMVT